MTTADMSEAFADLERATYERHPPIESDDLTRRIWRAVGAGRYGLDEIKRLNKENQALRDALSVGLSSMIERLAEGGIS